MKLLKPICLPVMFVLWSTLFVMGCDYITDDVNEHVLFEGVGGTDSSTDSGSGTQSEIPDENDSNSSSTGGETDDDSSVGGCDTLNPVENTMCDGRDGQSYTTVQVGEDVWMAENLNYALAGSICYDNINTNCQTYGRLYSWNQATLADNAPASPYEVGVVPPGDPYVQGVCPAGWHLPVKEEMDALRYYISQNYPDKTEGEVLKSTTGWQVGSNGLDAIGLNILPAGWYLSGGMPADLGGAALFWVEPHSQPADTGDANNKPVYLLDGEAEALEFTWYYHTDLASIRCVQNGEGTGSQDDTDSNLDSDTDSNNCAPLLDVSELNQGVDNNSGECCTTTAHITECLLADAAHDGLTCTADDLSNCAAGQSCSGEGLCTCANSCQCGTGRCSTLGVCLPSVCNGYYVCSCWGGCTWWDGNDPTNTPADDAAALNLYCCEGYSTNGTQIVTYSADPTCGN